MAEDSSKLNMGAEEETVYTLENILAEYKGKAYIAGEKKLSKEELEEQAARIIAELTREIELDGESETVKEYKPAPKRPAQTIPKPQAVEEEQKDKPRKTGKKVIPDEESNISRALPAENPEPIRGEKPGSAKAHRNVREEREKEARLRAERLRQEEELRREEENRAAQLALSDEEQEFFGVGKYARSDVISESSQEVESVISREAEKRRKEREKKDKQRLIKEEKAAERPELSNEEALKVYASGVSSLRRRTFLAFVIFLVMAIFAFADEYNSGLAISDQFTSAGLQLILLLVVMLLGIDIFIAGVVDLYRGRAGGRSLACVACLTAVADAVFIIAGSNYELGLPYCATAAFSLTCAMYGERVGRSAYRTTFRTMAASSLPLVVAAEWEKADEGTVLTKRYGTSRGFVSKSTEFDMSENVFHKLAPLLMIASVIFAMIDTVFAGAGGAFLHCFAAMTAVTASASTTMIFNLPFNSAAKKLASSGAALAGWSGAVEIKDSIGIVIKDSDLFPESTLSLNGVKCFSDFKIEKVVSYTGSMILASGSGLSRVFGDLLKEYACSIYRVDEFSCYESGGIGAIIDGDKVLVGSGAFMNLMGIRLAANLNLKSAVFTAVNDELAGVFIVNYMPVDMVQNALVTLARSKVRPIFAVRDFNITPTMVRSKFKVSTEHIEFLSFEARYNLSADSGDTGIKPSALMSREGLGHFVEIASRSRILVSKVRLGTLISAVGSIVGLLVLLLVFRNSAFTSASAANMLLFHIFWLIPVVLLNKT